MHAAVNFLQFNYGCYAPNIPALLRGKIPTENDKGEISEDDVKKVLPGLTNSLHQAGAAYALSQFSEDEVFLLPKNEKNQVYCLCLKMIADFGNFVAQTG